MVKENRLFRLQGKIIVHNENVDKVDFDLSFIIFEEEGHTICFCPALNLTGVGSSEREATDNCNYVLSQYFNITINKKTLAQDLKRLGWHFKHNWRKKITAPKWESIKIEHTYNICQQMFDYGKHYRYFSKVN